MAQEQPTPQNQDRPWYYQNWFLIAAFILGWPLDMPFVLWPVWAMLMLRSPWHNNTLIRGLAWAMLIVGAVLVVKNIQSPRGAEFGVALILPGFVVTVVTQVLWAKYKLEHRAAGRPSNPPADPSDPLDPPASSRRSRARRRVQRKRGSRSGRSPR